MAKAAENRLSSPRIYLLRMAVFVVLSGFIALILYKQIFEFFRNNPQAQAQLRAPIYEDKVVDFVLELAKVTDNVVTPEELMKDPEDTVKAA